jgi:GNAT superfamily N-acetyltransferase
VYDPNWQDKYRARLASPAQAIARIAAGRRILIGSGAAEPTTLVRALVEHGEHLADNEIVHLLTLGPAPYVQPEMAQRFRHTAFFIGANVREAVQAGRADFMPVFLSEIPRLIRSGRVRIDVLLVQVTPPDHRDAVHRQERDAEPCPADPRSRRRRRHEPWRRPLRGDRIRRRRSLGQEHSRTRDGVDRGRAPGFSCRALVERQGTSLRFPDQRAPRALAPIEETPIRLANGDGLRIRLLRMADESALKDLFYCLSNESTYQRFMSHKRRHPHEEMLELVDVDCDRNMALVVTREGNETPELIAMARYDVDPATQLADVALVVLDAWQGKGVGTALFRRLAEVARQRGVAGFTADVLVENGRMLAIFNKSGLRVESRLEGGAYSVRMTFE